MDNHTYVKNYQRFETVAIYWWDPLAGHKIYLSAWVPMGYPVLQQTLVNILLCVPNVQVQKG